MKYMNRHLARAIDTALEIEGVPLTKWAKKVKGITAPQISMLGKRIPRREALAVLCKESNWKFPKSATDITIAILNDMIEDLGRSTKEFNIKASGKPANIPLEQSIRKIEAFARKSDGAAEFMLRLASIIDFADEIESNSASERNAVAEVVKRAKTAIPRSNKANSKKRAS